MRLVADAAAAARGGDVTYYVQDELGSRLRTVGVDDAGAATAGRAAVYDAETNATLSLLWVAGPLAAGLELVVPRLMGLELLEDGQSYWARRMDAEEVFEWYCPFAAIAGVVARVLPRGGTGLVLVSGNGTSDLPVELERAHAGARIVAADYADNATARMRRRHPDSRVAWVTGDLTASFAPLGCADGSAALVLDKGCLDAMLIKPVRERADMTDTWAASSPDALAYLAAARACLRRRSRRHPRPPRDARAPLRGRGPRRPRVARRGPHGVHEGRQARRRRRRRPPRRRPRLGVRRIRPETPRPLPRPLPWFCR